MVVRDGLVVVNDIWLLTRVLKLYAICLQRGWVKYICMCVRARVCVCVCVCVCVILCQDKVSLKKALFLMCYKI